MTEPSVADGAAATISQVGEKRLIEEVIRPMFNPDRDANLAGDDCTAFEVPSGHLVIASTDRVPADLIAFKAGVLSYRALGRYLGTLNLSDIAACGGIPTALLFNCGLPPQLRLADFVAIAGGLKEIAARFDAHVAGGDITSSSELSLSATSIGHVERSHMLRRSGAKPGDTIFVSREIGLTPAALAYCLELSNTREFSMAERSRLEAQFTGLLPELPLGRALALSGECTSCMDNTDGVSQSLLELSRESRNAFVIVADNVSVDDLVARVARMKSIEPLEFALGPGADFSLIGTLRGDWTAPRARSAFGGAINVIGTVTDGTGIHVRDSGGTRPLQVRGWNYFRS